MFKKALRNPLLIEVGIILLVGLLSLAWFKNSNLINGGDFDFPQDLHKYVEVNLSSWDETASIGTSTRRAVISFWGFGLWAEIFSLLGLSPFIFERFVFYGWFAGSGLTMLFLARVLNLRPFFRLFAALFYMLNPFSLVIIWRVSHGPIQLPYMMSPFILGFFIKGLKKKKGLFYLLVFNVIWLVFGGASYGNPRIILCHWIPIIIYFLAYLLTHVDQWKSAIKYFVLFTSIWVIFNYFTIFQVITSAGSMYSAMKNSAESSLLIPNIEAFKLTSVRLLDVLKMNGYWSLFSGYKGEPYYPYYGYYLKTAVKIIGWIIPLLLGLSFFNKKIRQKENLVFFSLVLIGGIFFLKGYYPPFGNFVYFLNQKIPYLALLSRFNFLFYGLPTYLIFAVLIGFGMEYLYDLLRKRIGKFAFTLPFLTGFLLFFVLVFPFWSGEVILKQRDGFPGERNIIPDDWIQVGEWLKRQDNDSKILVLPMAKTYNAAFNWKQGYSGIDISRWYTKQPVLFSNSSANAQVVNLIAQKIEENRNYYLSSRLLGALGISRLWLRNDTYWNFIAGHGWWYAHNEDNLADFIKKQQGVSLVKTIGSHDFYQIEEKLVYPLFSVPTEIHFLNGEPEGMIDLAYFFPDNGRSSIVVGKNDENIKNSVDFVWKKPEIEEGEGQVSLAKYEFEIVKDGDYELFLRNDKLEEFFSFNGKLTWSLDQGDFRETSIFGEDQLLVGKLFLTAGKHHFDIKLPPATNLLENPSFETGGWGNFEILQNNRQIKDAQFALVSDASSDDQAILLRTKINSSLVYKKITKFIPGKMYLFSLMYKNISGNPASFLIWQNYDYKDGPHWQVNANEFGTKDAVSTFARYNLPGQNSWQTFRTKFKYNDGILSSGVVLASFTDQNQLGSIISENLFSKVNVSLVFDSPLIVKSFSPPEKTVIPQIEYKKDSPTSYKISVLGAKEPYFLVFSQGYDDGWKTSIRSKQVKFFDGINGWLIDKKGDYLFTVTYAPQKEVDSFILFQAFIVTLTGVLISVKYWKGRKISKLDLKV